MPDDGHRPVPVHPEGPVDLGDQEGHVVAGAPGAERPEQREVLADLGRVDPGQRRPAAPRRPSVRRRAGARSGSAGRSGSRTTVASGIRRDRAGSVALVRSPADGTEAGPGGHQTSRHAASRPRRRSAPPPTPRRATRARCPLASAQQARLARGQVGERADPPDRHGCRPAAPRRRATASGVELEGQQLERRGTGPFGAASWTLPNGRPRSPPPAASDRPSARCRARTTGPAARTRRAGVERGDRGRAGRRAGAQGRRRRGEHVPAVEGHRPRPPAAAPSSGRRSTPTASDRRGHPASARRPAEQPVVGPDQPPGPRRRPRTSRATARRGPPTPGSTTASTTPGPRWGRARTSAAAPARTSKGAHVVGEVDHRGRRAPAGGAPRGPRRRTRRGRP